MRWGISLRLTRSAEARFARLPRTKRSIRNIASFIGCMTRYTCCNAASIKKTLSVQYKKTDQNTWEATLAILSALPIV